MNKKGTHCNGSETYTFDSGKTFDKASNYNRERQGIHSNCMETIVGQEQQYDKTEMPQSTSYSTRKNYGPYLRKGYAIDSRNHFQGLNEKFQELETKMLEVENCFKEANRLEMEDVEKQFHINESGGSGANIIENRNINHDHVQDGNMKKKWTANNKSTFTDGGPCDIEISKDSSGDTLESSPDSCKTMIQPLQKLPGELLNRRGTKGPLIMTRLGDGLQQHVLQKPTNHAENCNIDLLEKSKKLILGLIDKELQKIEEKPNNLQSSKADHVAMISSDNKKHLKIKCIENIERELRTLKKLESLEQ